MTHSLAVALASAFMPYRVTVFSELPGVLLLNEKAAVSRVPGALGGRNSFIDLASGSAIKSHNAIPLLEDVLDTGSPWLTADLLAYLGLATPKGSEIASVEAHAKNSTVGSVRVKYSPQFYEATVRAGLGLPKLPTGMTIPVLWKGEGREFVPLPILPISGQYRRLEFESHSQAIGSSGHYIYWKEGDRIELAAWTSWGDFYIPTELPSSPPAYLPTATDGAGAVGSVQFIGQNRQYTSHALYWDVASMRVMDIHPRRAGGSLAHAIDKDEIVGNIDGGAALWRISSHEIVILAPTAEALDVKKGTQVGMRRIKGRGRAVLWRGTPESEEDLHAHLPKNYHWSKAQNIGQDGTIYGTAIDEQNRTVGVAWKPNPLFKLLNKGEDD